MQFVRAPGNVLFAEGEQGESLFLISVGARAWSRIGASAIDSSS